MGDVFLKYVKVPLIQIQIETIMDELNQVEWSEISEEDMIPTYEE